MDKKKKATTQQIRIKKLWDEHLKGHIAGFISSRAGQNEKSPARIDKAVQKGNLNAAREEFNRLKETDGGFLCPIFVKRPAVCSETSTSDQTTVGKRAYEIPGPRLAQRLEKAWEKFLTLIEQPAVSA